MSNYPHQADTNRERKVADRTQGMVTSVLGHRDFRFCSDTSMVAFRISGFVA
ncbi:hypothetical protein D8674_041755 [Pyrus ussuriensis x Pyrus communis]|uniref:Uncharacterized protein n=1 Tax=Pyrus ussuriensis x Pyrus communis TaxID=2448454 RepID=A0A5N5GF47_9ROSA|nr:hypothetical protein D8674_035989 [Pyrus ussuriensis x Pyrus communis]KAB2614338.1 hypothetical protein D8674_041755 [Pyrus ussuriensis x Pyrus communis]